ncbi:MAG TPA: isoprenylcysteine carboxylmethyltransferase family protein [Thermoanaerobaculaceae bacterium]|nr:isoprenylcysteine carboxylmethyltransferase family protein [Thermoanaerobaculaceae bacterium]
MVSDVWADSRVLYTLLVAAVGVERLVELAISHRNLRRALARGAQAEMLGTYLPIAVLHGLLLPACLLEVWGLDRPWRTPLGVSMLAVLAATMALRYWAVAALGDRWNVRVVVTPGDTPSTAGPYRWLRHPNYLAVALEVPALALVHGAWLCALAFGLANLPLLAWRIRTEVAMLCRLTSYGATGPRPPGGAPAADSGARL